MSDNDGELAPNEGTREIKGFVTYAGEGFASVRRGPERGADPLPAPASLRRYLRDGVPALYREEDFAMRLLAALEGVIDPIVAVLDMLPAHFEPELAPIDVLALMTAWLGIQHNEAQPAQQLRELVLQASELGRLRGTRAGLELALGLNFPELPLRVEDQGKVRFAADGRLPDAKAPSFAVYCDEPVSNDLAAAVLGVIDAVKPAHVTCRLRIKGARKARAGAPTTDDGGASPPPAQP
jgi:phage tail-like protein